MGLGAHHPFLVLRRDSKTDKHHVEICVSREGVLRHWDISTRISPLFGVSDTVCKSPDKLVFRGAYHLLFIGPVHPEMLLRLCDKSTFLWLTLSTVSPANRNRFRRRSGRATSESAEMQFDLGREIDEVRYRSAGKRFRLTARIFLPSGGELVFA